MEQFYYNAGKSWSVESLWEATKDNKVVNVGVHAFLRKDNYWNIGTFKDLAYEMRAALEADYSFPIIVDTKGEVVDGAHRLVHAYIDGVEWVPAVTIRDDQWPPPVYDEYESVKERYPDESKD